MDDNSIMPFGKYKDRKMANVPASYLLFLYDGGKLYGELLEYIEDNIELLKKEVNKNKWFNKRE